MVINKNNKLNFIAFGIQCEKGNIHKTIMDATRK